MQNKLAKSVDIIIPWRIGDAILALPMLLCLKQLNEKYKSGLKIRIVAHKPLFKMFSSLKVFQCVKLTLVNKAFSQILPSDKGFFLQTTSKNIGYKSKVTYGLSNPFKKLLKYSIEAPFLQTDSEGEHIPFVLMDFLKEKYNFPIYAITLFGLCLELGYSVEQITNTFKFSSDFLSIENFSRQSFSQDKYLVFCMEAAYGKKGDAYRCWKEDNFFQIAEKCHSQFNLKSVFVGLNNSVKIPDKPYFVDLRKKLDLFNLASVMKSSVGYIGNDTGPLHIANIMQKPSVSAIW